MEAEDVAPHPLVPPPEKRDHHPSVPITDRQTVVKMLQNFLIVPKMVFSVCFLCSSAGKTEVYEICISFCLFTFYSFLDLEADWG